MPAWIVAVIVASIAITALLTFVLWRMNRGGGEDGND
jgi:hypothetical protein